MDLIGTKVGYLTINSIAHTDPRGKSYRCKCDCGNEVIIKESFLIDKPNRRATKSCGCKRFRQNRASTQQTKLYIAHRNMKNRCYKPNEVGYKDYGAKGIKVCDEWLNNLEAFIKWSMENGYSEELTIDRIDSSKDYEPSNCRWVDWFEQARNKGIRKNNKTGVPGVHKYKYGYRVELMDHGKREYLGTFKKLDEAIKTRQKWLTDKKII